MKLLDHIKNNESLVFVDANSKAEYKLDELILNIETNKETSGCLAFLYLNNSINSTAIYLSMLNSNNQMVLLNDALSEDLKLNLEKEYQPSLIFDQERSEISSYETIKLDNNSINLPLFITEAQRTIVHKNIKVLLSTSGTTGSPKLVKLSDDNLKENALSIIDYLPINSKDVTPLNLPLYYSYGLSVLHSNAIAGGKIICGTADVLQRNFWNQLTDFGFTSIAGVPFVYEMLNRIGFTKKEYPSLNYLSQAGGNLAKNIKKIFYDYSSEHGMKFFVMYGQTEASARISFVPADKLGAKLTSIGKPIKNGTLSLNTDTGELIYSGPNVFGGYAIKKEDLSTWENLTELHTGDIGKTDEDGFFYIIGRLKRFVKIFGNRVNLDEIEAYLKTITPSGFLACIGINDQFILISHNHKELDESGLKKQVFEQFKIHPSSIKLQYLEEMPLTGNGKVNYKQLQADYQSS